jgi:hypothetical protein
MAQSGSARSRAARVLQPPQIALRSDAEHSCSGLAEQLTRNQKEIGPHLLFEFLRRDPIWFEYEITIDDYLD